MTNTLREIYLGAHTGQMGMPKRALTEAERSFLKKVIDLGGQLTISGSYDHSQWDQIVADKLVTREAVEPDVIYAITAKGRNALTEQMA